MSTPRKKVALGMSGGVDSSFCAHLLKEQGYDVTGVYLECWRAPGCRTEEDRKDALKIALDLGIPFKVLDFKQAYRDRVVEYFFSEYEAGRTPNPDVMCNKEIKFGLFYDWAMAEGYDYVATGHYADISEHDHQPFLTSAKDTHKDQTYFLYRLNEDQLQHVLFPIGHLLKSEVREEAAKVGLHTATKKDSVGICFIGDINVHEFLKERLGENPGEVVDTQGHVIGTHKGLWFYTVGQRHGFTIQAKTAITNEAGDTVDRHNIPPFYVIRKNPAKNQLVVGFGAETFFSDWLINELHILNPTATTLEQLTQLSSEGKILARIRHTGQLIPVTLTATDQSNQLKAQTEQPIQGLAEGQSTVLYQKTESDGQLLCVAGGITEHSL